MIAPLFRAEMLLNVAVLDLPEFWEGLFTALLGISFWIVALAVLYLIYERYLKDKDQPEDV